MRRPDRLPAEHPRLLVALDVDGTLVDLDERMSDRVRSAVRAVVDAGHHVVVATGRPLSATLPVLDRLGLTTGYAVVSNGSVTMRLDPLAPTGYEVVDAVTFDPAPALRLLRRHLPGAAYAVEGLGDGFRLHGPFPVDELAGSTVEVPFEHLLDQPVTRVVVRSTDHTSEDFLALVQRIGLHGVNYAVGWTAWLDLAPEGVSKASALEEVRARLGVHRAATVAIGDGRNDVEMLDWASRSVAMANAPDEVKDVAGEVTGTIRDDGAAAVLESLVDPSATSHGGSSEQALAGA